MNILSRDALIYLLVALPAALAFAILTPPLQTPDEVGHYWRSVTIAQGELISPKHEGRPSSVIPVASRDLVATLWMEMAGRPVKYERERLRRAWDLRPTDERVRVYFPAFYTAVPYTPQAVTMLVTGLFSARPLVAFYLGRIANACAGILLVALAMHLVPQLAWAFGIVGMTPMYLYLAGSFSADTTTTGLAFITAACAFRLWRDDSTARLYAIFIVCALLLALSKPVYFLVPLLCLPLWRSRTARPFIAAAGGAVIAGVTIASWIARSATFAMRSDFLANPDAQLSHARSYPFRVTAAVISDYARHSFQYFDHFVGRLGWLDIGLPRFVLVAYVLAFVYVALSSGFSLSSRERALTLAVVAGSLALVSLSQYLIWTPVASSGVDGIQGRYFLPIGPLVIVALSVKRLETRAWVSAVVGASGNAIAVATLYRHYY